MAYRQTIHHVIFLPALTLRTCTDAKTASILVSEEQTLLSTDTMLAKPLCVETDALMPFGWNHPQRRPWLVVHPGAAAATPRAIWLQPGGANIFPGVKKSSRLPRPTKSCAPSGSALPSLRNAARPFRTFWITDKAAMGATLHHRKEIHHG